MVNRGDRHERGQSLVEVLVALALMLMIVVGVLQLFSMALLTAHASAAQAEMTRKAEAVVEVIRLVRATGATGTSGILPLSAGSQALPRDPADTGWDFWGPTGMAVVEPDARYRLTYDVAPEGNTWLITVLVSPGESGTTYVGPVAQKGVRYVARLPQ